MPSPKRPPAFQFYADAWLGSVSVETMSASVEGTYIRLLARQWKAHLAGELLPRDPKVLRLLTKLSPGEWAKAWPVLEKHFPSSGEGRANPTLQGVWQERLEFVENARTNGRKGGRPAIAHGPLARPSGRLPEETKETEPITGQEPNPSRFGNPTPNRNGTSVVCGLDTDTPPTAADAAVGPPRGAAATAAAESAVPDPEAYAERRDAMRARFTDERHLLAFDRHCRASRHPDSLLLDIEAAARERPSDGAPPLPWDVIGTVLHELSLKGKPPSEHLIRTFAAPILSPRVPVGAGGLEDDVSGERRDQNYFTAVRYAKEGDVSWQRYCLDKGIRWAESEAEMAADFERRIRAGEFVPPELREVPS